MPMKGYPEAEQVFWAKHEPAANVAAVVAIAAAADEHVAVYDIIASFSGTAGAAVTMTVTDGTTSLAFVIQPTLAVHHFALTKPFVGARGATVTVTLPAGGASTTGKLNVSYL